MVKTYCVKKRKQTKCVQGSERYEQSKKNNRLMIKCTCASYGITKTRFVKSTEGGRLDIQKTLAPLGELHLRTLQSLKKYNYCGPGTDLKNVWKEETKVLAAWMKSVNSTVSIMIIQTH